MGFLDFTVTLVSFNVSSTADVLMSAVTTDRPIAGVTVNEVTIRTDEMTAPIKFLGQLKCPRITSDYSENPEFARDFPPRNPVGFTVTSESLCGGVIERR